MKKILLWVLVGWAVSFVLGPEQLLGLIRGRS